MAVNNLSICVFCGARSGNNPAHTAAAVTFGTAIGNQGWRLVYGAGDIGIMGAVAAAAQSAGAKMLGVIPVHLMGQEKRKKDMTQFVVTEDMHERKKLMYMNSDAVVLLPGGAGSLDEFFEILTWAQIGLHSKPLIILNQDQYWQPLSDLLAHIAHEGFADASLATKFTTVNNVPELVQALQAVQVK